jgi:5-hydroxyisourate hydrolase-like protein (transthyretin family)
MVSKFADGFFNVADSQQLYESPLLIALWGYFYLGSKASKI